MRKALLLSLLLACSVAGNILAGWLKLKLSNSSLLDPSSLLSSSTRNILQPESEMLFGGAFSEFILYSYLIEKAESECERAIKHCEISVEMLNSNYQTKRVSSSDWRVENV